MASVPIITVIGSLNMDLVTYTSRVPAGGETLTANSFATSLGGKGANQAVSAAKLSRKRASQASSLSFDTSTALVKMIGAVGDDVYGTVLKSGLQEFGVDVSNVSARQGSKTGIAVILVEETYGENRILLSPEANYTLLPEHFLELAPPLPSVLILQMEIPLQTVLQILKTAHNQGVDVILNPAPVPAQGIPYEYYPAISHLVMNETEASLLSGCAEPRLSNLEGLERVARIFENRGAKTTIITLGGRGVYYLCRDGKAGLVPAEKVEVVDTTAAGDTFIGAYALQVVRPDFDVEKGVRWANKAAARTVERKGAGGSIPWLDELE